MADIIRVETAELQQCITQYRSALSTVKESYTSFTKSLEALRSDWTGKAFIIMAGKVAAMGVNIARSFNNIEDAMSELSQMSELVRDTEKELGNNISAADIGQKSPFSAG